MVSIFMWNKSVQTFWMQYPTNLIRTDDSALMCSIKNLVIKWFNNMWKKTEECNTTVVVTPVPTLEM